MEPREDRGCSPADAAATLGKMRSCKKAHRAVYTAANVALVRNHDDRRSYAAHSLHPTHNGEPISPVTVMRWMGHASLDLTLNTYARDLPNKWTINRGSHLDFSVRRYERMPGFNQKLKSVTRVTN